MAALKRERQEPQVKAAYHPRPVLPERIPLADILLCRADSEELEVIPTEGVWLGLVSPVDQLLSEASLNLRVGDVMLHSPTGSEAVQKRAIAVGSPVHSEMFGQTRRGSLLVNSRGASVHTDANGRAVLVLFSTIDWQRTHLECMTTIARTLKHVKVEGRSVS